MDDLLVDSFVRLLGQVSHPAAVRLAEESGDVRDILRAVDESGFLDALVPELKGGSGLALADVVPMFLAAGAHLLPIPFAETVVARTLIATAETEAPRGKTIILWPATSVGRLRSQLAPTGEPSSLALAQRGTEFQLLPIVFGDGGTDPFRVGSARPDFGARPLLSFSLPRVDLMHWAAAITAANMAGAMERLLDMSLTHVNNRQQFGRPLGKFQAIQQQLSVFAERAVSAKVAARIGLHGADLVLDENRVAIAKSVANESARDCASIAHAVHGAIGISEAHDLQLFTRRLARWRISFGSDSYWQRHLGAVRLGSGEASSVDFVRALLGGKSYETEPIP
jgi:acyl-CoA dehydrogenase